MVEFWIDCVGLDRSCSGEMLFVGLEIGDGIYEFCIEWSVLDELCEWLYGKKWMKDMLERLEWTIGCGL